MTRKINEFNSSVDEGASRKELKVILEKIEQIQLGLSDISEKICDSLDETEVEKDLEDQLKYEEGIVMRAQMRVMEEENAREQKPLNFINANFLN